MTQLTDFRPTGIPKTPARSMLSPRRTCPVTRNSHEHSRPRQSHRTTNGVTDLKTESYTEGEASEGSSSRMSEKKSTARHVTVRRIYDEAQKSDGTRILVDRVWPRGVSKDKAELDDWFKAVAPSSELRKWYSHDPEKFDELSRRYRKELEGDDAAEALDELRDYAKKGTLTLLTASKRDDISQATVLAEILNGSDTKSGTKTSTDTEKTGKSKDSESDDDR